MQANTIWPRLFVLFGGIFGLLGVALAAAATHMGDQHLLGNASTMSLAHAPVLVALGLAHERLKTATPAGALMLLGTLLFVGDLLKRHYTGSALFSMSAPTGGILMMGGWLVIALGALWPRKG